MSKVEWVDYIVDTDKDYYLNYVKLEKLPLDKLSIQLSFMLEDYEIKLRYIAENYPEIYDIIFSQFEDFYLRILDFIANRSSQVVNEFYDISEILENNWIDCHGTLEKSKSKILYDIENKYHLESQKSFKVGEYLRKPEVAEFHDRVMAQLVCMFPKMKEVTSKKYTHDNNMNNINNTLENARLVEKLNEYAATYDKCLRYEDMQTMLDYYAHKFGLKQGEFKNDAYIYNNKVLKQSYTLQLYTDEGKRSNNLLTILMHLVVDYDFMSLANRDNTVYNAHINEETPCVIGENECSKVYQTSKRYNDIQEYLLPLMQAPYYSYFNLENFEDHTIFWKLDRVVKSMIEYLYSPIYKKVESFQKLEKDITYFKDYIYPMFMRKTHPKQKEQMVVKKQGKVITKIRNQLFKTRKDLQDIYVKEGLSIDQILNSEKVNQQNEL